MQHKASLSSDTILSVSASLHGHKKPYQPGLITGLLSERSFEVESSGLDKQMYQLMSRIMNLST